MNSASIRFGGFVLDCENRLLLREGVPVELNNRYLDALILLASQPGALISKDRFLEEVWRGVPVTDEALTQCIKILRRVLGDDAARPLFIETVPKHGYRFIAMLGEGSSDPAGESRPSKGSFNWQHFFLLGGAAVVGGGVAGLLGGLFYGFAGAAHPLQPGMGAGSIVLVLTSLTILIALIGAAGVGLGIAAALSRGGDWRWLVGGGAFGGLVIGGVAKLLGLDAFNLLLGQSPGNMTGALEGAALGGAAGLAVWFSGRNGRIRIWPAAVTGFVAGTAIPAFGGRLLGGSLDLLAGVFPQSRLRLDQIGVLFGEQGFGRISQMVTGGLEGMLFATCVAFAILWARQQLARDRFFRRRCDIILRIYWLLGPEPLGWTIMNFECWG
ncbi:MAG: transcriptional regulator [Sphingomonadaceae bacterium]|nr:transcriptional regulator [Sphingomonadaceae bacterium]